MTHVVLRLTHTEAMVMLDALGASDLAPRNGAGDDAVNAPKIAAFERAESKPLPDGTKDT